MHLLHKYPRTHHLAGSRLQPGDEDLATAPFGELAGRYLVVEEKLDGANAGLSFGPDGTLQLQSRGHFLTGGPRERHFALFKQWAGCHQQALWERLGCRFLVYGEWLYAKHTLFYDALPHYFLEFDVLDTERSCFLSTARRRELLQGLPLVSVPVLRAGQFGSFAALQALLGVSTCRTADWSTRLTEVAQSLCLEPATVQGQTDRSDLMEGLYVKVEDGDSVVARYKYVRASFLTAILDSEEHWLNRPIVPNQLRASVDLFGPTP
jgi:RNA ligase-like protein